MCETFLDDVDDVDVFFDVVAFVVDVDADDDFGVDADAVDDFFKMDLIGLFTFDQKFWSRLSKKTFGINYSRQT